MNEAGRTATGLGPTAIEAFPGPNRRRFTTPARTSAARVKEAHALKRWTVVAESTAVTSSMSARRPHLEQSIGSVLAAQQVEGNADGLADLRAIANDGRLDPWDRAGRQLPIGPLPDDVRDLSRVVRRAMLGAKRPLEVDAVAQHAARLAGARRATRVRIDTSRLLRSRPQMFRQQEGAFRLAGELPARRRWPTDQTTGSQLPQIAELERGEWLEVARSLAGRIDAEPASTPTLRLWDHEHRKPLVQFSLSTFFDDSPGARGAVQCVVAVTCVAGSRLVELLTTAGWRWRPAHVAEPRAAEFDRDFLKDPENLVTCEVGATDTVSATEAVLRTMRDHFGIRDPERLTVHLEAVDEARAAAVLAHLRQLRAAFDPPRGRGSGGQGDDRARPYKKVLATCIVCGRDLTDPWTAERLMGDDCRQRVMNEAMNVRLVAPGNDLPEYIDRVAASRQRPLLWARAVPESQWAQADQVNARRCLLDN